MEEIILDANQLKKLPISLQTAKKLKVLSIDKNNNIEREPWIKAVYELIKKNTADGTHYTLFRYNYDQKGSIVGTLGVGQKHKRAMISVINHKLQYALQKSFIISKISFLPRVWAKSTRGRACT